MFTGQLVNAERQKTGDRISDVWRRRVELVRRDDDDGTLSSTLCKTPLPGNVVHGYSITSLVDRVILTGGSTSYPSGITLATAYEGSLNETQTDVNWIELPSMKRERTYHANFDLGEKLYVVGGESSSSEWLDCSEFF